MTALRFVSGLLAACNLNLFPAAAQSAWEPLSRFSREEIVRLSHEILERPDLEYRSEEDIFRIRVLGMDWDVGGRMYTPANPARIPIGPDGKKAGVFILHGGGSDFRSKDDVARLLTAKFGFKVVVMSYPGTIYLLDPSRDWPGDTFKPGGSLRMPIWNREHPITPDQYESPVHFGGRAQLAQAARATARRLDLSSERARQLEERYVGYVDALRGPGVKPVPPVIFGMTSASAGHEYETYRRITLPMFAGMDPPPKVRLVAFDAGVHGYTSAEPELPLGPFPAVAQLWHDAILKGYYASRPAVR